MGAFTAEANVTRRSEACEDEQSYEPLRPPVAWRDTRRETGREAARTVSRLLPTLRRAVLRTLAAYLFAAALLLMSPSAFRQALSELRQTEPGSLLFGVLQLVIGTAAVVAAIGLVKRARWAAGAAAAWGVATAALLAAQPLFTTMDADARWSIWSAAAALGVAAAGVSWFARRLARRDAASHAGTGRASVGTPAPVYLTDARQHGAPIIARESDTPESRGTQDEHDPPPTMRASIRE